MNPVRELMAPTRFWAAECVYPLRFVAPDDGFDLAQLFVQTPSLPQSDPPQHLGAWIDRTLATLRGDGGPLLDGCSFVVEGRSGLIGALLVVLRADGPRIVDLAVAPTFQRHGIGTALVAATLDGLHGARYPAVAATVATATPHEYLLLNCGFMPPSLEQTTA